MKKSGFTLVELSISLLIIGIISVILIVVLRSNLNTFSFGQKHMDFNQKILLAVRRVFYDLKRINPVLIKSDTYGYSLKGENLGEPKPRRVFIRKAKEPNASDELEFVIDSNRDIDDIYNIKYFLKDNGLQREVRDMSAKTTVETILDKVASFKVDNDEEDIKQVYVTIVANDTEKGLKRAVDFAVRIETDFIYVDKSDL